MLLCFACLEIVSMQKEENIEQNTESVKETNIKDTLDDFYAQLEPKKEKFEVKDDVVADETNKQDPLLGLFYSEIDNIKSEEFKSSSKEQIERLLRPGSTYFNLNPFEVLQIDPYVSFDEIKKKYRKLSIYVHPDKNADDRDRAQVAFEAVNRAYKLLENEKDRKMCLEVVDEAREKVDRELEEKRKKKRQQLTFTKYKRKLKFKTKEEEDKFDKEQQKIDEDDPDKYRHAIYCMTCKLFADIERLKVREAEKLAEEK